MRRTDHLPVQTHVLILSCIAVLTILAWAYLFHFSREMDAAMAYDKAMTDMGMTMLMAAWTKADVALTFAMWAVMMVGMMSGSATPVLLVVARSSAARGEQRIPLTALAFGAGYFCVWTGFSAVAAVVQWLLHEHALLSPMMTAISPQLSGAILIAAGVYQLTPFKEACLIHCRSPLDFLMAHFRSGLGGAFRVGLHHGAYCLGCCWALMAVLFVVGVMNLAWVAGIGAFVLLEKTGRGGVWIARLGGVALIAAGVMQVVRAH